MRRTLFCFLSIFILVFSFAICGFCQEKPRVLVVYYSREGHTQLVAEKLAEKFGADIERLIDKKKRTGPIGFSSAGKDAIAGNLTKLEPLKHNPQDYNLILIGTPGWWGNVTPAVRTFITQNNISGKKIGVFGTSHLTGIENALKQVTELVDKDNASGIPVLPLRHRDLVDEVLKVKIDEFYARLIQQ